MPQVETVELHTVTIADEATTSDAASLVGDTLVGLITDAAIDSTAITFTVSTTVDGTYVPLHAPGGSAVSVTVAASRAIYLDPLIFGPWRFIKLVGGTAQDGADTVVTLLTRPL